MKVQSLARITRDTDDPTIETPVLALDPTFREFAVEGLVLKLPSIVLTIKQTDTERGWVFEVETSTPLSEGNSDDVAYGVASDGVGYDDPYGVLTKEHYLFWALRKGEEEREVPTSHPGLTI